MQDSSGLTCLTLLARLHGVAADVESLRHRHATPGGTFPLSAMLLGARELGLRAKHGRFSFSALENAPLRSAG